MDVFHHMFNTARHEVLHNARLSKTDHVRILDLGTGTGIWAIDVAE